ncbi:MAG: glycoside hydrolase family 97 protein [Melioribacteraceae bacterium]|nr:glycoside hydrolase family 97 protein [Melioribacteraceae bacterium]
MNRKIAAVFIFITSFVVAQKATIESPNKKINIALNNQQNSDLGEWYLSINYKENYQTTVVIPKIKLGLLRSDQDFSSELKFVKISSPQIINENYYAIHGKRSQCNNSANEVVVSFENPSKVKLSLIIRAYNDGIVFRYEFPEQGGPFVIEDEKTSYEIPDGSDRWMQKWDLANEGLYRFVEDKDVKETWSYPALFNTPDSIFWYLIHEADINRSYCGTKLSNEHKKNNYKLVFPDPGDGEGNSQPTISTPWKSPWRVIIIGSLADIVESTLIQDVCPPSVIKDTDWIKPGKASWNYWSNNHGTKDYKVVCEFADMAAEMDWEYTLLDWEWDQMANGGNLEDALQYIHSLGVKPLMWYNSGAFKWVRATPRDRMLTHENRIEEFTKLKKLGVAGIKVDFFLSEKQDMIKYYLDIIEDAAKYEIMVYFHGCIVPRGWSRTYPHVMTYEGIRGAEWYNNGPEFTSTAPEHNVTIPFTRNVVGAMDYTPVTFTNSQYPHITSYGHELAQSVVYESGIQHMADRPSGYKELPYVVKSFLKDVPNTWDDTKFLDGYPGRDVIIARRKSNNWYIGGLSSENNEKNKTIKFNFLQEGTKYKLTLIADGNHDKVFSTSYLVVDKSSSVEVKLLRRGGFAASLEPTEL